MGRAISNILLFIENRFMLWNETYRNSLWISNHWVDKELTGLLVVPIFGHSVLFSVDIVKNLFNGLELFDKLNGSFGADTTNGFTIIAAQQNTQIDELDKEKKKKMILLILSDAASFVTNCDKKFEHQNLPVPW